MKYTLLNIIPVSLVLAAAPISAKASPLSFDVETGIDSPTRAFLDTYPGVVKQNIEDVLDDAKIQIESTSDFIFNRGDQSVDNLFARLTCAGAAFTQDWKDAHLRAERTPYETLDKFEDNKRKKVGYKTLPHEVGDIYQDIHTNMFAINCAYNSKDSSVSAARLAEQLQEWNFLDGLNCKEMDDCYEAAYAIYGKMKTSADPRDVTFAEGAASGTPPKPEISFPAGYDQHSSTSIFHPITPPFNIDDYEAHLGEIYDFQLNVFAASMRRAADARAHLDQIIHDLQRLQNQHDAIQAAFDSGNCDSARNAIDGVGQPFSAQYLVTALQALPIAAIPQISDAKLVSSDQIQTAKQIKDLVVEVQYWMSTIGRCS